MLIRPATIKDARGIARVHVRSWQIAFRGFIPDAYLARITVEDQTNRWLGNLAELNRIQTLVAEDSDERITGWASFGASEVDLGQPIGQLWGLHVDPDHWNRGIGALLLAGAEAGLRVAGYERAILWTLAENTRTRHFYENHGWHLDGSIDTHPSGAEVVRYAKELGPRVDPEVTAAYDSRDEQTQACRVGEAPQGQEEG